MAGTTTLQPGTRWLFKKGVVNCNRSVQLCSREEDEIRLYTWKYAHAWRKAVKFRNKFDSPECDTIEYWISGLTALLRIARQIEKRYN